MADPPPDVRPDLKVIIEPFDPGTHDRSSFSSGAVRVDNYIHRTAKKHQKGDFTRLWIARGPDNPQIVGFYAVNAHALLGEELPHQVTTNAPRHGGIPALYLSMLGVDRSMQGRGLGRVLMADAMRRAASVSDHVGIAVMVLDVLEEDGDAAIERRRRFYERLGFMALPSRPVRMIIPTATIRLLIRD